MCVFGGVRVACLMDFHHRAPVDVIQLSDFIAQCLT
jgi:hypothetical protein